MTKEGPYVYGEAEERWPLGREAEEFNKALVEEIARLELKLIYLRAGVRKDVE